MKKYFSFPCDQETIPVITTLDIFKLLSRELRLSQGRFLIIDTTSVFGVFWSVFSGIQTLSVRIQSQCPKVQVRKAPNTDTSRSVMLLLRFLKYIQEPLRHLSWSFFKGTLNTAIKSEIRPLLSLFIEKRHNS